jgi:hypothetical protein
MLTLFTDILPSFESWFQGYVTDLFGWFAAGILISLIIWTFGYVVDAAIGYLHSVGR